MSHVAVHCPACDLELFAPEVDCPRCLGTGAIGRTHTPARSVDRALTPDERFWVLDTLGRGGMGIVYKVHDRELDEIIALKVLDPLFGDHDEAVRRFKHELKVARRINHPNVARLYDLCAWHGRLALSQEYIPGRDLNTLLQEGSLELERVIRYMRYLCSALTAAHQLGVVHRDLKPANILIDSGDRPRVLDFGIAVLAGSPLEESEDNVYGTPWYMSPEQAYYPERVDHRSDIYSLGVVLFRMLTGGVPFPGSDAELVFEAHLRQEPPAPSERRPGLPPEVDAAVRWALAKDPEARPATANELYDSLAEVLGSGRPERLEGDSGRTPKVLLVDDDRVSRRIVGDTITQLGVQVLEAENGYEGVESALQNAPDLVLLDLVMPVLDGRETLRILKSNPSTTHIPVVMLTALDDSEEAILSKELGAAAFLNKPVRGDVLELLVEKYAFR